MSTDTSMEPQTTVLAPHRGVSALDLREIWNYRDLLYLLTWREIKVKYKQTVLGAAWAVLQPFIAMVVFSLLFGRWAGVPSDGLPYPIFVYAGLLPWIYFSTSLSRAGVSLVGSSTLVTKVYFPRIMIPLSAALAALVDLFFASLILVGMMFLYSFHPQGSAVLLIPLLIGATFVAAVGCGLWLSALNVEYRDFQFIIPFLVQIWMFATPVIYPVTMVPDGVRWLLALNPMGGIIEAIRAVLLGHQSVPWGLLGTSLVTAAAIFGGGVLYFRRVERSFADVI